MSNHNAGHRLFAARQTRLSDLRIAVQLATVLIAFACVLWSAAAGATQIKLGLLGDSIVDDYLGPTRFNGVNTNLAAGSFGQIMAATRSADFDFGAFRSPADGTWDPIRQAGYEFNAATAGAAASTSANVKLDFDGQGIGSFFSTPVASNLSLQIDIMETLVAQGRVDTVVMSIGANDFFYEINVADTVNGGLYPDPAGAIDQPFIDDVANSILTGIDRLNAAGDVDIVVTWVPTIPIMDQPQIDGVAAVNALLAAQAPVKDFVFFDSQEWSRTGPKVDPITGDITVGGLVIPFGSTASAADIGPGGDGVFCTAEGLCPLDSHANFYIAEDGIHLNTLMQGQLANEIIQQLNDNFGHDVALISDAELLGLVGVTPIPVPGAVWLLGSALALLAGLRRRGVRALHAPQVPVAAVSRLSA